MVIVLLTSTLGIVTIDLNGGNTTLVELPFLLQIYLRHRTRGLCLSRGTLTNN